MLIVPARGRHTAGHERRPPLRDSSSAWLRSMREDPRARRGIDPTMNPRRCCPDAGPVIRQRRRNGGLSGTDTCFQDLLPLRLPKSPQRSSIAPATTRLGAIRRKARETAAAGPQSTATGLERRTNHSLPRAGGGPGWGSNAARICSPLRGCPLVRAVRRDTRPCQKAMRRLSDAPFTLTGIAEHARTLVGRCKSKH